MSDREFPTKQEIEGAVKTVLAKEKLERKVVIERSQKCYGYTAEQLKDRSCESLNTRLKSLTGVVINEMIAAETLVLGEDKLLSLPALAEVKKALSKTQKRRAARKRAAARAEQASAYPDTPLGKLLSAAHKKYEEARTGKIGKERYTAALKKAVTLCINEAGGEFFEELSMKLLIAVYGDSVVGNELTAGPDDNGIDGKLYVVDPAGFKETVFFQSKTKLNERAYVSIKVAREFLGVMTAYGATKGVLVTNSNFHRETRAFASKVPNLRLIDCAALFENMLRYGVGVKCLNGIYHIDDDMFLNCR